MIVVDASVIATALADDGSDGDAVRDHLLGDMSMHTPELLDLEVLSVLRRRRRAGHLDDRRAALAMQDLQDLVLVRYPHLPFVERIWELRHNMTPYDAAYVALAETLSCRLVTGDRRLSRTSGIRCDVEAL